MEGNCQPSTLKTDILERSIFQEKAGRVLLVADAYRGSEIKQALTDFFHAAAGVPDKEPLFYSVIGGVSYQISSDAELVVYVGHDGLMDFPLTIDFAGRSSASHSAIILACASRSYFGTYFEHPVPLRFWGRPGSWLPRRIR
jgi:hypothetical protein